MEPVEGIVRGKGRLEKGGSTRTDEMRKHNADNVSGKKDRVQGEWRGLFKIKPTDHFKLVKKEV